MTTLTLPGEKHFTASVLVVSEETPKKILLVHHKKTGMWLQPGGHIEQFENPIEAAVRETQEETGVDVGFLMDRIKKIDAFASVLPVPDFFLEEAIPAHKDEPAHFHLDHFYIVHIPLQDVRVQAEESHDIGWFGLEEALLLPTYENTQLLIKQVLGK